jgi:crotonobetainyl-CoA:carnitine CoA-transferase CaiB-like acyl-CoA transferase
MYAYSGILAALYERERTGRGISVDVSMLEALGEWMSQPVYFTSYGGHPAVRTGARHTSISPYGPYAVGDDATGGGQVFIGIQNEREWAVLCRKVLGRPELIGDERFATNPDRVAHDRELAAIIEEALAGIGPGQVIALLDEAGIACARLRTPHEFAGHPQLAARDRWREVDTPGGPVRAMLPPVTVPGREAAMGAVPAVGEHSAAIRAELGLPPGIGEQAAGNI